jgi:hypothetical protein
MRYRRQQQAYYGPLVPLKFKAAALFFLFVCAWGYSQDHHVHSLQGLAVAVLRDLSGVAQLVPAPHGSTRQPGVSATGKAEIPGQALAAYKAAAGTCPHLTWSLLAGIGKVESNHGRSPLPGVHSGQNFAGAAGPMQMGNGTGKAGNAWGTYGDGVPGHVYQLGPAAKAAARMLCHDGVRAGQIRQAVYAYNHAGWYVDKVTSLARSYQRGR